MSIKDWSCWAKAGIAVGLVVFVLNWPSTSSEWAAWVQAFGSIGAILGAIYLFDQDKRHQRLINEENKKNEQKSLIVSLKSELSVRQSQYMDRIGGLIDRGWLSEQGCFEWKVPDNPFNVYTSSASRLGEIQSDSLRELIIKTYAEMEGLLLTIETLKEVLRYKTDDEFLELGDDDLNYVLVTERHHRLAMELYAKCIDEMELHLLTLS